MRVFAALLAALVLAGCGPKPAPASTAEPALWRISDADSEIWLYGTVHVLPRSATWQGPSFRHAFADSGELILEADVSPQNQSTFASLAQRNGTLAPGDTLAAKLDPNARAQLARVAASDNLSPALIEHDRPWLAALKLSTAYVVAHGQSADAGVENALLAQARRRGMRLSFLETPEQQILTLADLPPADETQFLVASLHQIESENGDLDAMSRAWARGDVNSLGRQLNSELREVGPAAYNALITRRNAVWADEIARRLNGSGRIFIAVGAAHLLGPDGVVALLRGRGIHVEGP